MKPPPFRYHDPQTVSEVVALLGAHENAKLLAGGQSLMPMLNMRFVLPDHLIDLNKVDELAYLRTAESTVEIGGMTRQCELERSDIVAKHLPLMREAISFVGHRQTRNRGTLAGSLCHLDPSAELALVACALNATVSVSGPGGAREISFADFPEGYMTPSIAPDEVVTGVRFPKWADGHGFAFVEFARRHGDFAIASAAVLIERGASGSITRAAIALGGVSVIPVRLHAFEEALIGQNVTAESSAALKAACADIDAMDDIHAPASYRRHLAAVLAGRALNAANERMGGRA
jgi:carbon-monoxide dehydrogenase medium subunit